MYKGLFNIMALPKFTIRDLLEAGVHFGHQTYRWNPKMAPYIHGSRNGVHIMDLRQTVTAMYTALGTLRNVTAAGGRVLFVGSKRSAQTIVQEAAERSGQYYVNHRWLGGMLTNWRTINASIRRLKKLEAMFANPEETQLTKKELLGLQREYDKLQRSLGGIKNMGGLPDAIVVIDTNKENIAIAEANKLGIPLIAIVDSNCSPEGVDILIPGNDDSTRALRLYTRLMTDAILDGISAQVAKAPAKSNTSNKKGGARKSVVNLSPKAAEAAEKGEDKAETAKETAKSAKKEAAQAAAN